MCRDEDKMKQKAWPADNVIRRKVSALVPYARNSRTHSPEQISQIAASIKEWGFTTPILVDADGQIIAGHGRLLAAQKLGLDEVPTMTAEGWTDAQKKAYVIADNKLALNAGWDNAMLAVEMQELGDLGFDLDLTGFGIDEIGELFPNETTGLTDEDAVPEVPAVPVTVEGDVWLLGRHRLMCGDSTSIDAVERLMAGRKANICFTSPPYNAGSLNVKGNARTAKKYNSFDDNQTEDGFFDFLTANMGCMLAVADEVFYNIGLVQDNKRTIFKMVDAFGDAFKDVIYWKKKNVAPHIQKGVINNLVEFILCFGDGKRKFANPQFGQGTYWNVIEGVNASGNEYSDIHKATFPVYLPENIIKNFTGRNAIVIDCFGGTGTTIIACEKTARDCRMMELDPKYCDVIVKRWQDFTGQQASLEATGETFEVVTGGRA
jgi:DNA modification methylase